jgi:hypothetical protein
LNALIFKSILIGCPVLKKCVHPFYILHLDTWLVHGFGHGKVHFQNNCVQFWVWVNTFLFLNVTLLCVVVCGDRRGPAHWNVLIMFLLGLVHFIFTKPNSKKEKDCLVKGWDQHFLMYKIKQY